MLFTLYCLSVDLIVTFDVADVVSEVLVGILDHTDLPIPVDEVSEETLVSYAKESTLQNSEICRALWTDRTYPNSFRFAG